MPSRSTTCADSATVRMPTTHEHERDEQAEVVGGDDAEAVGAPVPQQRPGRRRPPAARRWRCPPSASARRASERLRPAWQGCRRARRRRWGRRPEKSLIGLQTPARAQASGVSGSRIPGSRRCSTVCPSFRRTCSTSRATAGSIGFRNTIGKTPITIVIATAGHNVKRSRVVRSGSVAFSSLVTGP